LNTKPYNDFADFLAKHFPYKVQKISINAGFTCPNRDGTKSVGGCTYCNNQTFSPEYCYTGKTVSEQLEEGIRFFSSKYPEMKFLAYFQAYTNTYGELSKLMDLYCEALKHPDVVGLIIGTRPDCIPDTLLRELKKMEENYFILIEYGVESTNNDTLLFVNRGHTYEDAIDTIERTVSHGLMCGIHLILGLPGESREMILSHACKISELPVTTIKLHQLQLIRNTRMARQYEENPELFHLFELDEYIDLCIDFIERLHPGFILERFVSQSPKDLLIAPDWGVKNNEFIVKINRRIAERGSYQGRLFV
jgi:radical SAM protein (TIGR01212 family)